MSLSVWYIITLPSSSRSTLTASLSFTVLTFDASRIILVIMSPPRPITSLIFSGSILNVSIFGAYLLTSFLGSAMASCMTSSISKRAFLAWAKASLSISLVTPLILISICSAVIPSFVPATLKSISPIWSSRPWMSVRIVYLLPSGLVISPIAIPATGALIGTPAAIKLRHPEQIVAWLDEPLLSSTSDTTLIV